MWPAVFAGLLLAMFVNTLSETVTATALPTIVGDLGGVDHIRWVTTAYILASTVMMPIYGKLGDLFGRKLPVHHRAVHLHRGLGHVRASRPAWTASSRAAPWRARRRRPYHPWRKLPSLTSSRRVSEGSTWSLMGSGVRGVHGGGAAVGRLVRAGDGVALAVRVQHTAGCWPSRPWRSS